MSVGFQVEVVLATRERQESEWVRVRPGEDIASVLARVRLTERFPGLDATTLVPGIHGVRVAATRQVCPGDRIELLRPLAVDPREARRRRAALRER